MKYSYAAAVVILHSSTLGSPEPDETLSDKHPSLLNASGYAFQLAVEAAVRAHPGRASWRVVAKEHPWRVGDATGYADLILTCGNLFLAVECKRSREASWIFLVPEKDQLARSHARIAWIDTKPHRKPLGGWDDIQVYPESPEAEFCAIRGQGETDRPMLERIAAQVVSAADGLCTDLIALHERSGRSKLVLPVVVTNADLMVGQFDPGQVDLAQGDVTNARFSAVEHVRFRKTLGPADPDLDFEAEELHHLSASAVRTVFIVKSSAFTRWIDQLEISPKDGSGPWADARRRADAMGQ